MDENDVKPVKELLDRFLAEKRNDDHFQAVATQVKFAQKIFDAVCTLCRAGNGVAAEALVRTLFDLIINTTILAKHPELLADFIDHGRLNQLEVMEATRPPEPFAKKHQIVIEANKGEVDRLRAKFKTTDTRSSKWHHFKTRDAIKESGLSGRMNLIYYKRASNIAHGEPMATVKPTTADWKEFKITVPEQGWKRFETLSLTQARLLMVFLFSVLNDHFKLGYDEQLQKLAQWTEGLRKADMEKFQPPDN